MQASRSTLALVMVAVVLPATASLEAQTGTLRGQVTDATGRPLADAQIVLVGTNRSVGTDRDGRYQLDDVPVGTVTLRVRQIGYGAQIATVVLTAERVSTLDFMLRQIAVDLETIVVTATGDRRAAEVPNAIARVDAARVAEEAAPLNLTSVIQGRVPGVQVINSSGTAGTGNRIRIRGASSLSLTNEPIVVVDGIRVDSRPPPGVRWDLATGGQGTSRLNDFDPDQVESIEVVKGPSAAALYGTDAANGVIVVRTKRGRAGPPVFNLYSEVGIVSDLTQYPNNYRGVAADGSTCLVPDVAAGTCQQVDLEIANPLMSATTSPLSTGGRYQLGGNVSGGSRDVRYFLAAEYEREDGVYSLPQRTRDSILEQRPVGYEIPGFVLNPNRVARVSLRGNLNVQLSHALNLQVNTGYANGETFLPWNDSHTSSLLRNGLLGSSDSTDRGGWLAFTPEEIFWLEARQNLQRITQSVNLTYTPTAWLDLRLVGGLDYSGISNVNFQRTGTGPDQVGYKDNGIRLSRKAFARENTVDFRATAQFQPADRISARTSLGVQYFRTSREGVRADGERLPLGAGSITAAADQRVDEFFFESRTLGIYLEQQVGYGNRLFVTGAVRADDNSAFGADFDYILYPKLGVSYLLQEQGGGLLNNLRLRGAWGASGVQPGPNDAVLSYTGATLAEAGGNTAGVRIGNAGNDDLRPERSQEWEAGLEAGLLGGRLGLSFTYYRRSTKDALVDRPLPPSLGLTESRLENIGKTRNSGIEAGINGTVVQNSSLRWNVSLSGSSNSNEVVELGEGVAPILVAFGDQRHQEGYPLGGYWQVPYEYQDSDGNGFISTDEITVGDTAEFVGYARPRYEVSFFNSLEIGSWLRISGLFDYRGGHLLSNWNGGTRCLLLTCEELNDLDAPLDRQARAIAVTQGLSWRGYMEPAWFVKLRELSFTFFAPRSLARMVGASRASLTISGRNLITITDYSGLDPEVQGYPIWPWVSWDSNTQPQVRYWTARLQLTF